MAQDATSLPAQTATEAPATPDANAPVNPTSAPATAPVAKAAHHETVWTPKAPEPEMVNGVKVMPTSYIPVRAELVKPKKMGVAFDHWHIEAVHIATFFILLWALFIGMWKRPNLR